MKKISILDIKGISYGACENQEAGTGVSVILAKDGVCAGVDVRGGGPATRETDLLNPINMVDRIHGVCLSGGSAFGLDAASGVMQYLEEYGHGFDMQVARIPIVCGASLFDLSVGNPNVRPNKEMGYQACVQSETCDEIKQGNYGAGCGASVGKLIGFEYAMKAGLGSAGIEVNGLQVACISAVNACGNVVDYQNNQLLAGIQMDGTLLTHHEAMAKMAQLRKLPDGNTTISCVVTNAKLTKAQCTKIAGIAHNGYARAIHPVHTMSDGDTIFVLATGEVETMPDLVGIYACELIAEAIKQAVLHAEGAYGLKAHCDLKKCNHINH